MGCDVVGCGYFKKGFFLFVWFWRRLCFFERLDVVFLGFFGEILKEDDLLFIVKLYVV